MNYYSGYPVKEAGVSVLWRITPPALGVVTLSKAKEQLRVDGSEEDTYIEALIGAATAYVDGQGALGKAMITQTWGQAVTGRNELVRILMGPVQALSAVKYYDEAGTEQVETLTDYEIVGRGDSRYVRPKSGNWPNADDRPDPIWIEYTTGYGDAASDVPDGVVHAVKLLVSHWFETRQAVTFSQSMPIPFGFEALINQEAARWYG